MIGNDVVDIIQSRVESNWQRKGFIEKLFTAEEQKLITQHAEPEIMVWLLWSMKEAAYKIYNRQTKIREYSPKKLSCSVKSLNAVNATGEVICCQNIYYTKTLISGESIHTIAVASLNDINNIIEIKNNGILKDENGIPYIQNFDTSKDVSISNHGRFEKVVMIN